MRRDAVGDDGALEYGERATREKGRRVRLPFCSWQGLGGLVVVLAVGAALVGEEPDANEPARKGIELAGHSGLIDTLRFSDDGRILLSSGWDRSVRLWGMGDDGEEFGEELARLSLDAEVHASSISPDGKTVAVAGSDGVAFWDWSETGSVRRVPRPIGVARALEFSPDGRLLAAGGYDDGVHLIDVATGRVEADLVGHRDVIRELAFTPDGTRLLSLSHDGRMKAWDVANRREIVPFPPLADDHRPVQTFALSPDGQRLALSRLGEADGRVEIRDLAAGTLVAACRGGTGAGEVHSLAFSRDGAVLASCGADLVTRFWLPETGAASGILEGARGWVRAIDFSIDARWIATSAAPAEVRLWRIDLPRRRNATAPDAAA